MPCIQGLAIAVARTVAICSVLALASQAHAAVEIIGTVPSYDSDVRAKLAATGRFSSVDYFNASAGTPGATNLAQYSSVLVYADAGFADATTLGNNLDAYLRAGGGVVVAVFAIVNGSYGLSASSFGNDFALDSSAVQDGAQAQLGTINIPADPLVAGVTSFDNGSSGYYNSSATLVPGAVDVADYSNGVPLVVKRNIGGVETVNLNFYPPSSNVRGDFWTASTDGTILLANALQTAGVQASVPEPMSLALLGTALAGVGVLRRRQKAA